MKKKVYFWIGIVILALMIISYFIKFQVDSGANYSTLDSLLGIMIFHNPWILGLYILIVIFLVIKGITIKYN